MLGTFDLAIHGFLVIVLLPIVLISLATGSKQPENSWFSTYYKAEPWLGLVGNLFLLVICAKSIAKLALHFGAVGPELAHAVDAWTNAPFLLLLLAVIGLWIRAVLRVRGARSAG